VTGSLLDQPKNHREREHRRADAVRNLVHAAAALDLPTSENLAAALAHTSIALLCIAGLDTDRRAHDLFVRLIRRAA